MDELFQFVGFSFLVVIAVWCVKERYQIALVNVCCLLFVGYKDLESLVLLVVSSVSIFIVLRNHYRFRYAIAFSVICLLSMFVFYKLQATYEDGMFRAALPLGMSFYTFRLLHYTIEVYKGNLKRIPLEVFLGYMFYLPVIVIGPIIRIDDWQKEVKKRRWDPQMFSIGLERILYGLVKITVFGNYLFSIKLAEYIEGISPDQPWLANYLDCIRYSGNSYMQFAGYTDIAIGFSLLLGIRITENFNYPFLAKNINDFWKRWHISLSEWCRDYIYAPIASSSRLPWLAIIVSMLVLGLWHELSPRYVLWAFFHGFGIVIWNVYNRLSPLEFTGIAKKIYDGVCVFLTLNFVIISFVWVKEASIESSIHIFKILFGWN